MQYIAHLVVLGCELQSALLSPAISRNVTPVNFGDAKHRHALCGAVQCRLSPLVSAQGPLIPGIVVRMPRKSVGLGAEERRSGPPLPVPIEGFFRKMAAPRCLPEVGDRVVRSGYAAWRRPALCPEKTCAAAITFAVATKR